MYLSPNHGIFDVANMFRSRGVVLDAFMVATLINANNKFTLIGELAEICAGNSINIDFQQLSTILAKFGYRQKPHSRGTARSVSAAWRYWTYKNPAVRRAIEQVYVNQFGKKAF